jgi:BlaI family penicillinase repressor
MANMNRIPRITETEWELMQVLWQRGPVTSQEIVDALMADDPSWHPKTARTLLGRLVKKKALGYRKEGRGYVYRPLVKEADCVRAETESFVERVFGGALKPMLAHAIESRKLSKKEVNELKSLLEQSEDK